MTDVCAICLLPCESHFSGPQCSGDPIGCAGARRSSALTDKQLMAALGIKSARFYVLKRRGDFQRFTCAALSSEPSFTRYSGRLVQDWIEAVPARVDGRTRERRVARAEHVQSQQGVAVHASQSGRRAQPDASELSSPPARTSWSR